MKPLKHNGLTLIETAVVLLVISILLGFLSSLLSNFSLFRSTESEAETLKNSLIFCAGAALKSDQTVYFELNIDENFYVAYRIDRSGSEMKKDPVLNERRLSASNSIVDVYIPSGNRLRTGSLVIPFAADGSAEEIAIHLGADPQIDYTVMLSRYGMDARVYPGDVFQNLQDPNWKENLEDWN